MALCAEAGLLCAQVLSAGSLAQVMDVAIDFPSTVPARLGLPALGDGNKAEGVVIRTADTPCGQQRLLFKRKIKEFSERCVHEHGVCVSLLPADQ